MPSSAVQTAIKASIENLISEKTLIELTNQRENEVGETIEDPPPELTINYDVLDEAIRIAASEIEEILGALTETDYVGMKYALQLAIRSLASEYSVNITSLGIANREQILKDAADTNRRRVAKSRSIKTQPKVTGFKENPSGFDPLGGGRQVQDE